MLLGSYTLDILVNGIPLPEISQPFKDLEVPVSTGPSYFFDETTSRWHTSDFVNWAKVQHPGSYFTVRFSSSSVSPWSPIMAYLVIDGQMDYRYMEVYNTGFHFRDHFISSDKSIKYFFKFNDTIWSGNYPFESDDNSTEYGGLGAISLYFYRARSINEMCDGMPRVEIKQPILREGRNTNDIKITTGFNTIFDPLGPTIPNMNYLQSIYCVPIGVLHLHYRPASWFMNFDSFPIKYPIDIKYNTSLNNFTGNMMVKVNQEPGHDESEDERFVVVKQEPYQDFGLVSVKQENENSLDLISVKQENENSLDLVSVKLENENSLDHPSIKVEPIETINIDVKQYKKFTKSNDFGIHKKNENGRGIKKFSEKNRRKKMQSQNQNHKFSIKLEDNREKK